MRKRQISSAIEGMHSQGKYIEEQRKLEKYNGIGKRL